MFMEYKKKKKINTNAPGKVIALFQLSIQIKHSNISGAGETDDTYVSCIDSVCVCVCTIRNVCEHMFMHACRAEPVCVCVFVS